MKIKSLLSLVLALVYSSGALSGDDVPMSFFVGPSKSVLGFTITSEGKLVLPVKINGKANFLFLDTGSSTVLDLNFARQLGLNPVETKEVGTGLTGLAGNRWTTRVDIQLGPMIIKSYPVSCLDLSALRTLHKKSEVPDLVGLVGSELLAKLRAQIDYDAHKLTIRRPDRL